MNLARVEMRSEIRPEEAGLDEMRSEERRPSSPLPSPLRWKQMCAIWLGMLPVNLMVSWLLTGLPWWGAMPLPLRSVLVVSVLAPLMTFAVMPTVRRMLHPWLQRHPGVARTERMLHEALDAQASRMG